MRWRLLLLSPFLVAMVLLAVSTSGDATVGFWPTTWHQVAPFSIVMLAAMAVAFLLGSMMGWLGALPHRRRASRAETKLATLQAEHEAFRAGVRAEKESKAGGVAPSTPTGVRGPQAP